MKMTFQKIVEFVYIVEDLERLGPSRKNKPELKYTI